MWTEGGQPNLLGFAGVRGGGKGGGKSAPTLQVDTAVDPETGQTFQSTPVNVAMGQVKPASAQLAEYQAQRRQQQQAQSDADKATAAQKAADAEAAFGTRKNDAYNTAYQEAVKAFNNAGVNTSDYVSSYIKPELDRRYASIQDLDPNPLATLNPDTLGSTIVNQATADRRTQATNALNSVFTPNYANTALPDTLTAPTETTLLNEQFDPLSAQLQNAQKRGQLNSVGYNAALDALNQKKSAAQSQIHSLGQNILAQDRSGLNDVISGARSDVNNLSLASSFNPTDYWNNAAGKAADYTSGFGGALRNAVGGTKFADLTDLLNAGGAVQGATNSPAAATTTGALSGTLASPDDATKKRGLGNVGAF